VTPISDDSLIGQRSISPAPDLPPSERPGAVPARTKRQRYAFDWRGLSAFAIYFALAFLFFGRGVVGRFSTAYIGKGVDPQLQMWLMAWWPHALRHGLNPFYTYAVWAPRGVNLTWATGMPLLSFAVFPIVGVFGPVPVYNALCLLAVTICSWCAFILCRYLTGEYWPSLVGGYVFGFSAYMLGHTSGHLFLIAVFIVPLFALLVIRGARMEISRSRFVAGLVLLLAAQFLIFVEVFATMTLFAGIGLTTMLMFGSSAQKERTASILPAIMLSYAITAVLVSPYLYGMISLGYEAGPLHPSLPFSIDLLNLIIPTPTMEPGRLSMPGAINRKFLGDISETGGYIGLPLILVVISFARSNWQERWARGLVLFFLAAVLLSLGPFLLVAGHVYFPLLSGVLLASIPVIDKALPARFMLYSFLALAIMAAKWLSNSRTRRMLRILFGVVIMLSVLPNLSASFWNTATNVPAFFRDALYRKFLFQSEIIAILPYSYNGNGTFWQLQSDWYFRLADGYATMPPIGFRRWPAVRAFLRVDSVALPAAGEQLRAFMGAHQVSAVLVDDREEDVWRPLLATLGVMPVRAGGITLYRMSPAELAPWKNSTALEMETRASRARFAALVLGTEALMRSGGDLSALTPADALKAAPLPAGWVMVPPKRQPPYEEGGLNLPRRAPDPHLFAGMWLKGERDGRIEVGVVGWYPALRGVLDEYRAAAVDFSPHEVAEARAGGDDDRRGRLVITFTAAGLGRTVEIARAAVAGK